MHQPATTALVDRVGEASFVEIMSLLFKANEQRTAGQWGGALDSLDRAVARAPDFLPAYVERAHVLDMLGRHEAALDDLDRFLQAAPAAGEIAARRREVLHKALRQLDSALAGGEDAGLRLRRANLRYRARDYRGCLVDCRCLLDADPLQAAVLNLFGHALLALDRPEEAARAYREALAIDGQQARLWFNLGNVQQQLGHLTQARAAYERALELAPELAEAEVELAHCHLLLGEFVPGWRRYEARWRTPQLCDAVLPSLQPRWTGLGAGRQDGKTLLVWAEQGLGDSIQFARFLGAVVLWFDKVYLRVQRPLLHLFVSLDAEVELLPDDVPVPPHDLQIPLLSLPLALGVDGDLTVNAYLGANSVQVEDWARRLGEAPRPRIGLTWAGRQYGEPNRTRDIPLGALRPLFGLDVEWVLLQPDMSDSDRALLTEMQGVPCRVPALADFADTAALMANLDLVISADTAVAHLAGALGRPCWLLLRHASEWRWQRERLDSPWYPSLRLFRQRVAGDWATVIGEVAAALEGAGKPSGPGE